MPALLPYPLRSLPYTHLRLDPAHDRADSLQVVLRLLAQLCVGEALQAVGGGCGLEALLAVGGGGLEALLAAGGGGLDGGGVGDGARADDESGVGRGAQAAQPAQDYFRIQAGVSQSRVGSPNGGILFEIYTGNLVLPCRWHMQI